MEVGIIRGILITQREIATAEKKGPLRKSFFNKFWSTLASYLHCASMLLLEEINITIAFSADKRRKPQSI